MFFDVNELKPGGLENFKKQLIASLAVPQRQIPVQSGGSSVGSLTIPQRAHVAGSSGGEASNLPPVPDQTRPSRRPPPRDIETGSAGQWNNATHDLGIDPRYLLLCVNTRNLTKLLHVDLRHIGNDQVLFDSIRRSYWEARRGNSWHYGLLTPRWLATRMSPAWRDWLETLHLQVPQSAELIEVSFSFNIPRNDCGFVLSKFQFRLVPFHTNICPDKIRLGLPPEDQVKVEKNYLYDPCPTDVEVLSIPKFSHLLKPGIHSYDFWLKTFPKKLRTELAYQPAVIGWGLIIHETWDWVILLSNLLVLMILVGIAVVLWALFAHDTASALGFGAYAVAVTALLLTVKYWAWQEQEVS
jgi:hypothetical protein